MNLLDLSNELDRIASELGYRKRAATSKPDPKLQKLGEKTIAITEELGALVASINNANILINLAQALLKLSKIPNPEVAPYEKDYDLKDDYERTLYYTKLEDYNHQVQEFSSVLKEVKGLLVDSKVYLKSLNKGTIEKLSELTSSIEEEVNPIKIPKPILP